MVFVHLQPNQVKEYIPLKQGLRLPFFLVVLNMLNGKRIYSIKTRIKTKGCYINVDINASKRIYSIKTRIKTVFFHNIILFIGCKRIYSIKTRIKTSLIPKHII